MKKLIFPNTISLSAFVKLKRKQLGLTQKSLADKSGTGLRFIRDLEQDKVTLQMNKVNQVLILFGYELGPLPVNREKWNNEKSQDLHA